MIRFFGNKKSPGKKQYNNSSIDFMIVGLGNPGSKYEFTRHNAGFYAVDAIARNYGTDMRRLQFKGTVGKCVIDQRKVLLLKPSTFMNLSGQSVTEAMRFYRLLPEQVLVIFDDISFAPGKIRIRRSGSDGGQNGMKNIIYLSGSDQFPRIKLGVGKKPHPDYDLSSWVLSKFTESEHIEMNKAYENTIRAAELIAKGDIDLAMSTFNG